MVSLGRALLAALPAESKTAYLASGTFKPVTPRTVTDPHRLGEQLARVESDGYAWADGELDTAICGIAVPLRDPAGSVVAALSINAISGTITEAAAKRKLLHSVEKNRPGNSEPDEQLRTLFGLIGATALLCADHPQAHENYRVILKNEAPAVRGKLRFVHNVILNFRKLAQQSVSTRQKAPWTSPSDPNDDVKRCAALTQDNREPSVSWIFFRELGSAYLNI